ncbi:armadillo-type protein [Kalaharituber pfeilii]|nr:armadillo-type protein [Kalaharituber pfeilii]
MAAVKRKKDEAGPLSAATAKKIKTTKSSKPVTRVAKETRQTNVKSRIELIKGPKVTGKDGKEKSAKADEIEQPVEVEMIEKPKEKEKKKLLPKAKAATKIVDEEVSESDEWDSDDEGEENGGVGLDHADDREDAEEDAEGNSAMEGNADKPAPSGSGSSKSREAHAAQKKLAAERRASKPNAEIVTRGKRIWERLRRHELPGPERKKLVNELCGMIKGNVKQLVFKHDASRIVQTAVKRGTPEQKLEIMNELKGSYVELAQSTYGRYLLVKLLHYGDLKTKSMIIKEFYGHVRKLIKHGEASLVMSDIWQYANSTEQERLIREFYGVEFAVFRDKSEKPDGSLRKILENMPEKRAVIMKSLFELLKALAEKGALVFAIVHRALLEFISNAATGTSEVTEFLELVIDHFNDLAFSKPGASVIQYCITHGTAKDRKAMLKNLKPMICSIAGHEAGYKILLSIYECVDDTTLVAKTVLPGFIPEIMTLACNNVGRISLLYPFAGRSQRLLHAPAIQSLAALDDIRAQTSKKDLLAKKVELIKHLAPIYMRTIIDNAPELVQDAFGSKFISEVIFGANDPAVGIPRETMDGALDAIAETAVGEPKEDDHVMQSPGAGRLFKNLVQGGPYDEVSESVKVLDPPLNFHSKLYKRILPDLGVWATSLRGSWVVLSLLEAQGFGEKEEVEKILKENMKKLEQVAVTGNKGAAAIVEKLKG